MNNMLKRLLDILASAAGLLLLSPVFLLLIYLIRKTSARRCFSPKPGRGKTVSLSKW